MKKKYIKPSITVVNVDTESLLDRASDANNGGHIDKSDKGDMWAGSKDNSGSNLWEDDEDGDYE